MSQIEAGKAVELADRSQVSVHSANGDSEEVKVDPYTGTVRTQTALDRYLNLKPMVAFGLTLQASWEAIGLTFQAAMFNGGPVSLFYGMILTIIGSLSIAASLGEMASINPTVGAQYRWSALYAPRAMEPNFWGLLQGWVTVFAWISGCALTPFLLGTITQGLIIFNYETYVPERWHATLLAWAFVAIPVIWNIYARKILPVVEIVGGVCHFIFFICTVVILCVMAPRSTPEFVFKTGVWDQSGWESHGVSWCIGLLSTTFPLVGFDGVLHMSDEVKDAPRRVPWSMVWTVILNGTFAFAFVICLLFTVGDLDRVLASPTGYPIIEVYYQATKSKAGTNVMMVMIMIVVFVSCFSIFASVSRLIWAFARDRGMPFSDFFSQVHPTLKIPVNALGFLSAMCCLLALINIGSTVAFYAILSLSTLGLYMSYWLPILLLTIRKLEGRAPSPGPFHMGKLGIFVNIFALIYGLFIITFLPFPIFRPVTAETMNYAGPIMGAAVLVGLGDWFTSGQKRFRVPNTMEDILRHEQ
ncbi:amino acid permease [Patellaria atrata CBS 101060]|uniref:Amino acid permease n=1 Tax=Patellaria atrata CBS 101060 TaxID=1346257 RepID=A0A9P4SF16_9PEZI|nr:amino acid permease [Patellaria atrata CBS 101060]